MTLVTGRLRDYINYGVALCLTATAIALARRDVFEAWAADHVYGVLTVLLLVTTLFRMVLYHSAVRTEVDLMEWALDTEPVIVLRGPVLPIVVGLSVAFAALIATAANILLYSAVFVLFTVLDMFGPIVITRNVGAVLIKKRFRQEELGGPAYVVYNYYFENPTILRVAVMLVAAVGCLVLAMIWHYKGIRYCQYSAYGLAIATVVVGEIVIRKWRIARDREVDRIQGNSTTSDAI